LSILFIALILAFVSTLVNKKMVKKYEKKEVYILKKIKFCKKRHIDVVK